MALPTPFSSETSLVVYSEEASLDPIANIYFIVLYSMISSAAFLHIARILNLDYEQDSGFNMGMLALSSPYSLALTL